MTNFYLNSKKTLKDTLKDRSIYNNYIGRQNTLSTKILSPNTFTINSIINPSKNLIEITDEIRAKPQPSTIQGTNYTKVIKIRKDTTPVREGFYDYTNSMWQRPIIVDTFRFCKEQKISTVFSTQGNIQWFSTLITKEPSFKISLFSRVIPSDLSLLEDCSCNIFDFNGLYEVDRRLPDYNSLISSSNRKISRVSLEFDPSQNYIIVSFYSHKTKSYAKIRMRPPLRYRPIYNDWVFDESVIIDNIMSSTEYAEIIDCCQPLEEGEVVKNTMFNKNV